MKQMIGRVFARYGSLMSIEHDGQEQTVRAFLQPVTEKSRNELMQTIKELGTLPMQRYVYIGPPEVEVYADDIVRYAGEVYCVCRTEMLRVADGALYMWALLRRKEAGAVWTD